MIVGSGNPNFVDRDGRAFRPHQTIRGATARERRLVRVLLKELGIAYEEDKRWLSSDFAVLATNMEWFHARVELRTWYPTARFEELGLQTSRRPRV